MSGGIVNVLGYVATGTAVPVVIIGAVEYMKMRWKLHDIEKTNVV